MFLYLLLHLLTNLNLLLNYVRRKLSCFSKTISTRKLKSHCSLDWEAQGSCLAIGHQFARRYWSTLFANYFEYRALIHTHPRKVLLSLLNFLIVVSKNYKIYASHLVLTVHLVFMNILTHFFVQTFSTAYLSPQNIFFFLQFF